MKVNPLPEGWLPAYVNDPHFKVRLTLEETCPNDWLLAQTYRKFRASFDEFYGDTHRPYQMHRPDPWKSVCIYMIDMRWVINHRLAGGELLELVSKIHERE